MNLKFKFLFLEGKSISGNIISGWGRNLKGVPKGKSSYFGKPTASSNKNFSPRKSQFFRPEKEMELFFFERGA